ncbi:MAG: nuclear transport factor 2 family protein [Micromonosporaceae bacterium]
MTPGATPESAVRVWWQAMRDKDLACLAEVTMSDHLGSGGPGGLTTGRDQLLAEAAEFFAAAEIEDWSISGLQARRDGGTAVCAYRWSERGTHQGAPFGLSGVATDVLLWRAGRWRHLARHTGRTAGDGDG